jgi:hypothetical protein
MLRVSKARTDELKRLRKYFLFLYVGTTRYDPKKEKYGKWLKAIGEELNERTGEKKYKR